MYLDDQVFLFVKKSRKPNDVRGGPSRDEPPHRTLMVRPPPGD